MGDERSEAVTYLPAALVRAAAAGRARELPWYVEVEGTLVMADLSGFTAMSERLARLGDEGAERLTVIINAFFARMLLTAVSHGGDTLTFGGDAILLLFEGPGHAERAARASLAMLRQVERAAAVEVAGKKMKIGMSVGAHSGVFVLAAAGERSRAHFSVLGRDAELTARAEAQAERGELAVSPATKALLPHGCDFAATGDYWRVDCLAAGPPRGNGDGAPIRTDAEALLPAAHQASLEPFLPPYVRDVSGAGAACGRHAPDHRRAVVVFVDVLGLADVIESAGEEAALERWQTYSELLTRLAGMHCGFVVSSDIATEGTKLIVTFGAPVAHEFAPANAARFALDLDAGLRRTDLDLRHRIGVNGGHVFAGEVGPQFRRQYTVMGDAVNLAARLMAAADPGQVLAGADLLGYVSHAFRARELPPITVKGKEKPVAVCALEDGEPTVAPWCHDGPSAARPGRLFGRRAQLDLLARRWERVRRGAGRTMLVEGEAGVGKTRLVEEALRAMAASGRVTRAACFEYLKAAPFTPWIDVLRSLLEVVPGDSRERRTAAVLAFLERRLPDQLEVGPLLDPLLDLSLPQGPVVRSLDARARRARLFELVARILEESAGAGGRVVVLEDVHWVDESSLAMAAHLAVRLRNAPVLLLLTSRPVALADCFPPEALERVVLAELTEAESLAMLRGSLCVPDLPGDVAEALYSKTRGNPLFLEEVVRSLHAPGVLDRILGATSVTRGAELAALEIPDRVQGLLLSRIDRLPADTREVLKAGSVVGRSFEAHLLTGIGDELLRGVPMDRAFSELVRAGLVVPDDGTGDCAVVCFRHALVQDVAYESLPFSRRRELHSRVARYLEAGQAPPDHGLLVHHYRLSSELEKTRFHAVRASESSVAVYANREAVDYLAVALATATRPTARDACLRSRFEELAADSLETMARYEEAVSTYRRARRRWASPAVRAAAGAALAELSPIDEPDARDSLLCWKIAVATERGSAAYDRALRWLDKGASAMPPGRLGLTARLQITRGGFLSRVGRFREAAGVGEEGMGLARRDGDAALQAYGLTLLGVAYDGLGNLERSLACHAEAIELYERAGDLHGVAMSHGNLADTYYFLGDLRAALENDERSLALHSRMGSASWIAREHGNLGATLLQMGDLDGALDHLRQALAMRSLPDVNPVVTGMALVFMCQTHVYLGDLGAAAREIAEGRRVLERINSRGLLLDARIAEAELDEAKGDLEAAEVSCRWVLAEARSMGAELNQVQALCALGRIQVARGEPQAATRGLDEAVLLAERIGAGYERARALAVLAEAQAACGEGNGTCEDLLAQAIRLFEQAGARRDLARALEVHDRLAAT